MATILHLPPELKIEVFTNLSDFDDVYSLGASCWSFQAVLAHKPTHLSILKSIITSSPVFTHDIKLARIQDQTSTIQTLYERDPKLPESGRLDGSVLSQCLSATPDQITDADVIHILRRWRASNILQRLYVDEGISKLYSADSEFNEETYAPINTDGLAAAAGRIQELLPQLGTFLPASNTPSRASLSAESRQRFYKALTAINLTLSSHWLLSRTHTSTWQELQTLFDAVWSLWDWRAKQIPAPNTITPMDEPPSPLFAAPCASPISKPGKQQPHGDLRDVAEMLEIYNFLYTFLLRIVFPNPDTTRPWLPERTENLFVETNGAFRPYHWSFFVRSCDRILSPTDILDVLTSSFYPTNSTINPTIAIQPKDRILYLQARGATDIDHGTSSTRHPDGVYLDWCISERELAECVWRRVSNGDVPMNAQLPMGRRLWLAFRGVWGMQARGSVFKWDADQFHGFVGSLEEAMARSCS